MKYKSLIIFFAVLLLSGCSFPQFISPYKLDIPQGNTVTADQVGQLKPGMTRAQVRFLLGTPLLTDLFHADRWDYLYTDAKGGQLKEKKDLTLYFDGDLLDHFEGDTLPTPSFKPRSSINEIQTEPVEEQ